MQSLWDNTIRKEFWRWGQAKETRSRRGAGGALQNSKGQSTPYVVRYRISLNALTWAPLHHVLHGTSNVPFAPFVPLRYFFKRSNIGAGTVTKKSRYLRGNGFLAPTRRERGAYPFRRAGIRCEQRSGRQKDMPPGGLRRVWVLALLLLGHRSMADLLPDKSPFNRRYATASFPGVYRGMNSTATGSGRSATCSRSDMHPKRFCVS